MEQINLSNLVQNYFKAYETKEKDTLKELLNKDFIFSSPVDDHINRETYFARCWPSCKDIHEYHIQSLLTDGNEAVVRYECELKSGATFHNMEHFRFAGNQIKEIVVYFGYDFRDDPFANMKVNRFNKMSKVILDISMSLDGFIAGTNDNQKQPLGDGGEEIQGWLFSGDQPSHYNEFFKLSSTNKKAFDEPIPNTGAMIVGRRTFDIVNGWGGSHPVQGVPIFVVTHEAPESFLEENTSFTFVTDGIESAVQQAKEAAKGKNVSIGTASIAQQCIRAGLLDEMYLHVSPILLGKGIRLFDQIGTEHIKLESEQVIDGSNVVHLKYKLLY